MSLSSKAGTVGDPNQKEVRAPGPQYVTIYHKRRWTLEEVQAPDFDPASEVPPLTLFDVPLDSKVFGPTDAKLWERVLLRKGDSK